MIEELAVKLRAEKKEPPKQDIYIGFAEQVDNLEVTKVTEILSAEKSEGKGAKNP